jgi:uroporphyrinogen decarboxylase
MKPRDRIQTALDHRVPDRCPMQVSFTPEFASRLKGELGLSDCDLHNPHGGGNTYRLERELGADMLLTSIGWANSYYQDEYGRAGMSYVDEWGVGWRSVAYETPFGTGHYTEIVGHPLADESRFDAYRPPDPDRPELYVDAARAIREFGADYWMVGVTVTTIFETAWALRGLERTLTDFVDNPELAERLLDIPHRFHLAVAKRLTAMGIDMLWVGDDVGGQTGMLISPATWRRFLRPRLAAFIEAVKNVNPRLKVAYHSDGHIMPIVPDLIEIGVDVLNPVQPGAMDPGEIKRRFGSRLSFWGTIDEQHTLPFATAEAVAREVRERIATVGRGGGLIVGPTHHVQLDTPMANFQAMVRTIRETPCV